jgi:hypothetical protein
MENDSMTPSVLRYSDQIPQMSPQMDLQYVTLIPSNGASFSANQEIRVPINVPADSFCDMKKAYFRFKVTHPTAAGTNDSGILMDPYAGIASFISTFRVVSGTGALLEEIQHYDALCAIMRIYENMDVVSTRRAVTEGTTQTPLTAVSISHTTGVPLSDGVGGKQKIAGTQSRIYCHEPVSAVFNADKLMPFGYTQGTSYVSLQLNSANGAVCQFNNASNSAAAWTISEVELVMPVLRPGPEFANNFRTLIQSGLPINIHSVGFQNSQQNIAENATGMETITFSTRKRSVKSVLTALRINSSLSSIVMNSSSGFKTNDCVDYQYSVGGKRIPSAPIKVQMDDNGYDGGSLLNNTLQALGHYNSNLRGFSGDFDTAGGKFLVAAAEDDTLSSKAVFALDLETYGEGLSGMNLAGQGLPLVLHLNSGGDAGRASTDGALIADLYVVHDVIFTLDGVSGTLSASS